MATSDACGSGRGRSGRGGLVAFGLPKGDAAWRACVNAWVRDLLDSGRMVERLDYWFAQPVR